MTWAATYLVKEAANRARFLQRTGMLSGGATKQLRRAGMLPTVSQNLSGLQRGNVNLREQLGVPKGPAATPQSYPTAANPKTRQLEDWQPFSTTDKAMRGEMFEVPGFKGMPVAGRYLNPPKLGPRGQQQYATLMERHELDELRAGSRMADPHRTFYSHLSPQVIRNEQANARGLSQPLQQFVQTMRGETGARGLNGVSSPSQYDWAKTPATVRQYGVAQQRALKFEQARNARENAEIYAKRDAERAAEQAAFPY